MLRVRRPSPALIVALLALVVAMSGTAYAAGLITGKQVKNNSLTGIDVKNKSLSPADFRGSVQGPQGPQGAPGLSGLTQVSGPTQSFPPGSYGAAPNAQCPSGTTVVGTGFNGPFGRTGGFVKAYGSFVGGFFDNESSVPVDVSVQAICAREAGSAGVRASRESSRGQFARDVAAAKDRLSAHQP